MPFFLPAPSSLSPSFHSAQPTPRRRHVSARRVVRMTVQNGYGFGSGAAAADERTMMTEAAFPPFPRPDACNVSKAMPMCERGLRFWKGTQKIVRTAQTP